MEVAAKVMFKRADPKKLSANEPNFYHQRFMDCVRNVVFDKPLQSGLDASNPIIKMVNQAIFDHFVSAFK